jgi:hypothetical protein
MNTLNGEQQLQRILPWYVNASLVGVDRTEVERKLTIFPGLQAEVAWLSKIREDMQTQRQVGLSQRSPSEGLDTLMALVRGEQTGNVVPLRQRFTQWATSSRHLAVSMGIAATILVAQTVVIGYMVASPDSEYLVPLSGGGVTAGAMLQITFKPQATESQIRLLLGRVRGQIVSGPGALGVYLVRVPDGQAKQALGTLQADSAVIDSVVSVQGQ